MADNLPPSSSDVTESGNLNLPEPSGPHRPVTGLIYLYRLSITSAVVCWCCIVLLSMNVGPCHYGMARPQVADGGTASDMEGSCE
jgi:hypothetical protein